jgi:hypothetical protein
MAPRAAGLGKHATGLADPRIGDSIVRKADDGRRREAIQEIPVTTYGTYDESK